MTRDILLYLLLSTSTLASYSQSQSSFVQHIEKLCSKEFAGRGAEFNGDGKAAKYISDVFKKNKLKPYRGTYYQSFKYSVNTFEGAYDLSINDKKLKPGEDFMVHPGSKSGKGHYKTVRLTVEDWKNETFRAKFLKKQWVNKIIIYDKALNDPKTKDYFKLKLAKLQASALVEVTEDAPIAAEFSGQTQPPTFIISREKLNSFGEIKKFDYNVEATLKEEHPTQNVYGIIRGKSRPNEYIIVSAHYDHIGHLGKDVMIQGANDNASGVAMIISLAEHFSKPQNQPEKSIVFMAFAAEEIGLVGSDYYVKHPVIPLDQTKFVLNLDLMGSGSEGITVVNGEELEIECKLLEAVNEEGNFVKDIKTRRNRANSDHFHFTTKDIPAFFIYARGNVGGYHNLGDTVDKLEKDQFDGLFGLFKEFINAL